MRFGGDWSRFAVVEGFGLSGLRVSGRAELSPRVTAFGSPGPVYQTFFAHDPKKIYIKTSSSLDL